MSSLCVCVVPHAVLADLLLFCVSACDVAGGGAGNILVWGSGNYACFSVSFRRCTISKNEVDSLGGGLSVGLEHGHLLFEDCEFLQNTAST